MSYHRDPVILRSRPNLPIGTAMQFLREYDPTPKPAKGWDAGRTKLPRRWLKHLSPRRDLPTGTLPIPDHSPENGQAFVEFSTSADDAVTGLLSPEDAAKLCARIDTTVRKGFAPWILDWLVAERGVEFALEACAQTWTWFETNERGQIKYPKNPAAFPTRVVGAPIRSLHRLRYHLARADDATWESARRIVEVDRAGADRSSEAGYQRCVNLTYLFPTHAAWVDEDLETLLDHPADLRVSVIAGRRLSSCLHDTEQFDRLVPELNFVPDCLPDLVHQFGGHLTPWLGAILGDRPVQIYRRYAKDVRAALDLVAQDDRAGQVAIPTYLDLDAIAQHMDELHGVAIDSPTLSGFVQALKTASAEPTQAATDSIVETLPGLAAPARAAVSWALVEQWRDVGVPAEDGWLLGGMHACGDADHDGQLGSTLVKFRTPTAMKRAIDVLFLRGTPIAIRGVLEAERGRAHKSVRDYATKRLDEWCASQDVTREQIDDRGVPDFGLRDADELLFDFGTRSIYVGFDQELRPTFRDNKDKVAKRFPRGSKSDDPILARAAGERWKVTHQAIEHTVATQTHRLELAMGSRRQWSADELRTSFVEHPLLATIARRLVWSQVGRDRDADPATFRIAEDDSFATHDDQALHLGSADSVQVCHPIRLSAQVRAQWGELFSDYELLQPFEQLARTLFVDDAQQAFGELVGTTVRGGAMRRLTKRGWRREKKTFGGFERSFGDVIARIHVRAPTSTDYPVSAIEVIRASDLTPLAWATVAPEVPSEVRLDLQTVLRD